MLSYLPDKLVKCAFSRKIPNFILENSFLKDFISSESPPVSNAKTARLQISKIYFPPLVFHAGVVFHFILEINDL